MSGRGNVQGECPTLAAPTCFRIKRRQEAVIRGMGGQKEERMADDIRNTSVN